MKKAILVLSITVACSAAFAQARMSNESADKKEVKSEAPAVRSKTETAPKAEPAKEAEPQTVKKQTRPLPAERTAKPSEGKPSAAPADRPIKAVPKPAPDSKAAGSSSPEKQ